MKESDLLEPVTAYGASKAAAAIYCQHVAKKYSLPIATLRLFPLTVISMMEAVL